MGEGKAEKFKIFINDSNGFSGWAIPCNAKPEDIKNYGMS